MIVKGTLLGIKLAAFYFAVVTEEVPDPPGMCREGAVGLIHKRFLA